MTQCSKKHRVYLLILLRANASRSADIRTAADLCKSKSWPGDEPVSSGISFSPGVQKVGRFFQLQFEESCVGPVPNTPVDASMSWFYPLTLNELVHVFCIPSSFFLTIQLFYVFLSSSLAILSFRSIHFFFLLPHSLSKCYSEQSSLFLCHKLT